jgi:transcription termination/antitermination protein NusA
VGDQPTFLYVGDPAAIEHREQEETTMSRDFVGALLQLNAEKQVSREALVRALEEGIQAAYRRVAAEEDIFVRVEPESGRIDVYRGRYVVDEVEDPMVEVTVEEARETKPDARAGDVIELELLDGEKYGRIGAQTAKQIILQRIREVERDQVFDQFASREGELITGSVSRVEPRAIILDVGKGVEAVLATSEQSPLEHYRIGQPVKAFVLEVRRSARGPQILVSRTHKGFLRRLFELEVPEIHAGTVEIKAIAREAGSRSKVAVASRQEGLDPVGATVGQRGARVQAVVAELAGEKIDVIPWNDDASVFVANALSPAQVLGVVIDEEHRIAAVTVPERMLSLAIGREGQNARLAARLTGWRIDIRSDVTVSEAAGAPRDAAPAAAEAGDAVAATGEAVPATGEAVLAADAPLAVEAPGPVAADEASQPVETEAGPEAAPATPKKRTTKAKAATEADEPATDAAAADAPVEAAAAEPAKRTRAKAKPVDEPVPADGAEPAADAPAAKPKRAKQAAPEEVSS